MAEDSKHEKRPNWLLLNILKLFIIAIGFTPHLRNMSPMEYERQYSYQEEVA